MMDPKQLELDLRVREEKVEARGGAFVVDLEKVRSKKRQKETEHLYQAIISSVSHITPPPQKYK